MQMLRKKLILCDQISCQEIVRLNQKEVYFTLDPVALLEIADWTEYEDNVEVINKMYKLIFDQFIIERKTIQCFWPHSGFNGNSVFELAELCKSGRIKMEILDTGNIYISNKDILPKFQVLWIKFILFILETLVQDIKMNESIDEIAILKCRHESILIFNYTEYGIDYFSYVKTHVNLSNLMSEVDTSSLDCPTETPLFQRFEGLMSSVCENHDLENYLPMFINRIYEKLYYRCLSRNIDSSELVRNWLKNSSQN